MATYNSNLITAGQQQKSVYPGTVAPVIGSVTIASNTSFATTDKIQLFTMPGPQSSIVNFWIDLPALDGGSGLTLTLEDALASPTVIVSASTTGQAGGWVTVVNAVHGTIGAAVNYSSATNILMVPSHASTSTTGATALTIYFGFEIQNGNQ